MDTTIGIYILFRRLSVVLAVVLAGLEPSQYNRRHLKRILV